MFVLTCKSIGADPDWSAEGSEKSNHVTDLDKLRPSMRKMIIVTRQYITKNLVLRVPREFTIDALAAELDKVRTTENGSSEGKKEAIASINNSWLWLWDDIRTLMA
jgi:hypothetical protein